MYVPTVHLLKLSIVISAVSDEIDYLSQINIDTQSASKEKARRDSKG